MGFVFQFYNLLPVLSAVENVELPLLVSGVRLGEARKRSLEALEQVGLSDRAYHRPAELSGGERQRTTIARALVNRPALVWGDEPTGDLDSETAHEIMDVLVNLNREQQLTFILVTHDRGVGARCERIVRMRDGLVENQPVRRCRCSKKDGKALWSGDVDHRRRPERHSHPGNRWPGVTGLAPAGVLEARLAADPAPPGAVHADRPRFDVGNLDHHRRLCHRRYPLLHHPPGSDQEHGRNGRGCPGRRRERNLWRWKHRLVVF